MAITAEGTFWPCVMFFYLATAVSAEVLRLCPVFRKFVMLVDCVACSNVYVLTSNFHLLLYTRQHTSICDYWLDIPHLVVSNQQCVVPARSPIRAEGGDNWSVLLACRPTLLILGGGHPPPLPGSWFRHQILKKLKPSSGGQKLRCLATLFAQPILFFVEARK